MKFGIFVCILVVLAYHEVVCSAPSHYPVLIEGNCKPEQLPRNVRNGCNKVDCTVGEDGEISFTTLTCSVIRCPDGTEVGNGPRDLTKQYPDCCPPTTCP